jgi:hypothetical protein
LLFRLAIGLLFMAIIQIGRHFILFEIPLNNSCGKFTIFFHAFPSNVNKRLEG